jgi:hypothetical protein
MEILFVRVANGLVVAVEERASHGDIAFGNLAGCSLCHQNQSDTLLCLLLLQVSVCSRLRFIAVFVSLAALIAFVDNYLKQIGR